MNLPSVSSLLMSGGCSKDINNPVSCVKLLVKFGFATSCHGSMLLVHFWQLKVLPQNACVNSL